MVTSSNLLQNYSFILNVRLVLSFSETSCVLIFSVRSRVSKETSDIKWVKNQLVVTYCAHIFC